MFRVICHLDMDAFYASVEQRDNPALRGQPVIVGAPPTQRGVVCAASYEARKFGVRSAMPSATAGRLCPGGIFVRPRMERYQEESEAVMKFVADTGAIVEQMSRGISPRSPGRSPSRNPSQSSKTFTGWAVGCWAGSGWCPGHCGCWAWASAACASRVGSR